MIKWKSTKLAMLHWKLIVLPVITGYRVKCHTSKGYDISERLVSWFADNKKKYFC